MKLLLLSFVLWSLLMTLPPAVLPSARASEIPLYLASPSKQAGGLFLARLDTDTGRLTQPTRLALVYRLLMSRQRPGPGAQIF